MKNVLCELMRTGKWKSLFSYEMFYADNFIIYRDGSNNEIGLYGSAITFEGIGIGTLHFEECSCDY